MANVIIYRKIIHSRCRGNEKMNCLIAKPRLAHFKKDGRSPWKPRGRKTGIFQDPQAGWCGYRVTAEDRRKTG